MVTLAAWSYADPDTGARAERALAVLAASETLAVHDAIVVDWPGGRRLPAKRGLYNVALSAALDEILWSMLIGIAGCHRLAGVPARVAQDADQLLIRLGFEGRLIEHLRSTLAPRTWTILVLAERQAITRIESAACTTAFASIKSALLPPQGIPPGI
jgi:uncharacterized membrane protein